MHNYNPPSKYSLRTRMGNWSEEWDLEETKYFTDHLDARSTCAARTRAYPTCPKENAYSPRATRAYILSHTGLPHLLSRRSTQVRRPCHALQWQSRGLPGYVSPHAVTDIFEKTSSTEQAYNVSAVKNVHACARSVFVLERYNLHNSGQTQMTDSKTVACTSDSRCV